MGRALVAVKSDLYVRDPENPTPVPISIAHGIERAELYQGVNTRAIFHEGSVISLVTQSASV